MEAKEISTEIESKDISLFFFFFSWTSIRVEYFSLVDSTAIKRQERLKWSIIGKQSGWQATLRRVNEKLEWKSFEKAIEETVYTDW